MGYFLINIYSPYVNDWTKSYEITRAFLNQAGVRGYSYNGYIGMGEPLAHFEVRFNFENFSQAKQESSENSLQTWKARLANSKLSKVSQAD